MRQGERRWDQLRNWQKILVILALAALTAFVVWVFLRFYQWLTRGPALEPRPTQTARVVTWTPSATPRLTATPTRTLIPSPTVTSVFCTREPTSIATSCPLELEENDELDGGVIEVPVPQPLPTPRLGGGVARPVTPVAGFLPGAIGCEQSGEKAWEAVTRADIYYEATIEGGDCWVVSQFWTDFPQIKVWVMAVPPQTRVVISPIRGGVGWFLAGDQAAVEADLLKQRSQLGTRQGERAVVVILPRDAGLLQPLSVGMP